LAPHTQGKWNLNEDWTRLLEIAERQYAVVARRQAFECGMTTARLDRCIKQGRLELLLPTVYRMPGSPRTGRQRAMAARLWLGDDARVSHVTAAALLRLDGCTARQLHLTTLRTVRRRAAYAEMQIHRCNAVLPFIDHATVDGIPCTSATRTVIDCAEYLGAEALEVAFESARRMGLTSPRTRRAREALCGSGKPGSAAIGTLLSHQRERKAAAGVGKYRIDLAYDVTQRPDETIDASDSRA
jgi:predicted transcriptional regulator of viral defense system